MNITNKIAIKQAQVPDWVRIAFLAQALLCLTSLCLVNMKFSVFESHIKDASLVNSLNYLPAILPITIGLVALISGIAMMFTKSVKVEIIQRENWR